MSNMSENISQLLKSKNLSTVSGQQVLGISKTQLGKYISGFYMPSLKNALIICNCFKCSLDYLMGIDLVINRFGEFLNPSYELFNLRFEELIKEHGLTKYLIAKTMNFNRNNITYWQMHKSFPSLDVLQKLAQILKVSIEFLIGRTDIK